MIHIVENKAYKSDGDRSLRSYYDRLRERIETADFNVNNLTLEIKETLEYINSVNEMLEEFRVELLGDVEEIRPFLPEKQKTNLDGTLDKIKEALQGNDIKDITKEIEDASTCLAACQSCFTGTFDRCINVDDCAFNHDSGNTCIDCVSEQIGCRFCDSDQNTCVVADSPCGDEYTSACTSCYQKLYNSCSQEQITCNYDAGCTNCQNNVQSCNRCFTTTYSTCSNCYGGSYNTCGEGQINTCGASWLSCNTGESMTCSICNATLNTPPDCTKNDSCGLWYLGGKCPSGYSTCKNGDVNCTDSYATHDGGLCSRGFSSCNTDNQATSCTGGTYTGDYTYCKNLYTDCPNLFSCSGGYSTCTGEANGPSCVSVYNDPGSHEKCTSDFSKDFCKQGYSFTGIETVGCEATYSLNPYGKSCATGYTYGSTQCISGYEVKDLCNEVGCKGTYRSEVDSCSSCYGTAYGCSGCYDVAYCSKCNTTQAFCTSCVKGQTTCEACVKGEEGHSEDVCSNCYGGCQATWEQQKDCFTGSYGTPPACTICNVGCQYCDTGCYSGQSCGDCGSSNCGSSNCGASNCGSGNCGTANCGTGQCNQSGCENCDDVSACLCSHTGSYGCNFPMHS